MTNKTMCIFFPLKVISYLLNDYDWDDENPVELSSEEAVAYEEAVLAAIAHENRRVFENDRGLAEYIENEALNKKVYSLNPSVEVVEGKLKVDSFGVSSIPFFKGSIHHPHIKSCSRVMSKPTAKQTINFAKDY